MDTCFSAPCLAQLHTLDCELCGLNPLQVCPQLQQLATRALDPEVEPASASEGRLILRCTTAVLRKHTDAVQDAAPPLLSLLIDGCMPGR
jgi:hypothetical protein